MLRKIHRWRKLIDRSRTVGHPNTEKKFPLIETLVLLVVQPTGEPQLVS